MKKKLFRERHEEVIEVTADIKPISVYDSEEEVKIEEPKLIKKKRKVAKK